MAELHNSPQFFRPSDGIYVSEGPEERTICVAAHLPPGMARSGSWRVEDFELHKELYRGKTSLLYMATDRRSGTQVALKLYRKRKLSVLNRYQVEREMRIHIAQNHENIIKLYAAFEDEKHVYMVQEFALCGDLFEDLKKGGGQIKEKQAARDVILPFLNALVYLHAQGIVHRDIKPENILLGAGKVLKVADFGLSINVNHERPVTRAGTLDYMAPEVLICPDKRHPEENKEKVLLGYTAQVDSWAVGILAYELLVGYPPFEQESRAATYEHIMYKEPKFPAWMSEDARRFIALALCKNSTQRPTIHDLLRHSWIQSYATSTASATASPTSTNRNSYQLAQQASSKSLKPLPMMDPTSDLASSSSSPLARQMGGPGTVSQHAGGIMTPAAMLSAKHASHPASPSRMGLQMSHSLKQPVTMQQQAAELITGHYHLHDAIGGGGGGRMYDSLSDPTIRSSDLPHHHHLQQQQQQQRPGVGQDGLDVAGSSPHSTSSGYHHAPPSSSGGAGQHHSLQHQGSLSLRPSPLQIPSSSSPGGLYNRTAVSSGSAAAAVAVSMNKRQSPSPSFTSQQLQQGGQYSPEGQRSPGAGGGNGGNGSGGGAGTSATEVLLVDDAGISPRSAETAAAGPARSSLSQTQTQAALELLQPQPPMSPMSPGSQLRATTSLRQFSSASLQLAASQRHCMGSTAAAMVANQSSSGCSMSGGGGGGSPAPPGVSVPSMSRPSPRLESGAAGGGSFSSPSQAALAAASASTPGVSAGVGGQAYHRPQPGVLSDDSAFGRLPSISGSAAALSPLQQAVLAQQRPNSRLNSPTVSRRSSFTTNNPAAAASGGVSGAGGPAGAVFDPTAAHAAGGHAGGTSSTQQQPQMLHEAFASNVSIENGGEDAALLAFPLPTAPPSIRTSLQQQASGAGGGGGVGSASRKYGSSLSKIWAGKDVASGNGGAGGDAGSMDGAIASGRASPTVLCAKSKHLEDIRSVMRESSLSASSFSSSVASPRAGLRDELAQTSLTTVARPGKPASQRGAAAAAAAQAAVHEETASMMGMFGALAMANVSSPGLVGGGGGERTSSSLSAQAAAAALATRSKTFINRALTSTLAADEGGNGGGLTRTASDIALSRPTSSAMRGGAGAAAGSGAGGGNVNDAVLQGHRSVTGTAVSPTVAKKLAQAPLVTKVAQYVQSTRQQQQQGGHNCSTEL